MVRADGPGGPYTTETAFLVGCDGAGSAVRSAAGIGFPGTGSSAHAWVADVTLDDPPAGLLNPAAAECHDGDETPADGLTRRPDGSSGVTVSAGSRPARGHGQRRAAVSGARP
ncbi:FAD-dependent monooxygenase [Microbispora bryophytorum]|uniref:FAD-binding domain-containing protein n=1 Tax=Microbispora bryophytorum TaxID=1460882 RepID=A0A8H9H5E4_9ACTN|nr:FAD-dependent monooxygenase [Microbispora bryophytorum]MBD3139899.1 FAD-dependent monooxygenase [Microbispora bryophytorum]TQS01565.1 hypothetical protein FLX07_32240 [Microbispora bryophytorum]GGO28989.1 hypothetical protein GCM10011574_63970 [Microbispora bryophytorum]